MLKDKFLVEFFKYYPVLQNLKILDFSQNKIKDTNKIISRFIIPN